MSDAPPPTPPPPSSGRNDRKAKRREVAIVSRICYRGMRSIGIVIHDLAFTGFRAAVLTGEDDELEFAAGERVSVDLPPFGLVPSRIAWSREGKVGGLFDAAVDIRHCVLRPDEMSYFTAQRLRTSRSGDRLG